MTRRNIQKEIVDALAKYPDGMTVWEISEAMQCDYETVRTALKRHRPVGVYIDKWVLISNGPPSAIYKAIIIAVPDDAPKPTERLPRIDRDRIKLTRVSGQRKKSKAQEALDRLPTQGLTVIRGPWPTHH